MCNPGVDLTSVRFFPLPAASSPTATAVCERVLVDAGLWELRVDNDVVVRTSPGVGDLVKDVRATTQSPLRFRMREAGGVWVAAATQNETHAWLCPLDEG